MKIFWHSFLLLILITSATFGQSNELIETQKQYQVYYQQRDYVSAVIWVEKVAALEIRKKSWGGQYQDIAVSHHNLPELHSQQAKHPKQDSSITAIFELATAKHKRELEDLRMTRNARPIELHNVSLHNVTDVLEKGNNNFSARNNNIGASYPEKTAVLFYSYDQRTLEIWLIDAHGLQTYHKRKIPHKQIAAAINNLRSSLGVEALQFVRTAHRRNAIPVQHTEIRKLIISQAQADLTEILIPASIAAALDSIKHLIIVPVLELGTIPYAMLKLFKSDSYLIDKMSISMAPSIFDLWHIISGWEQKFSSPLVIGNPYLPRSSEWVIPPLLGAEEEAQAVAKMLDTTPLLGKKATKEEVLRKAPYADFLYFATHGVAENDDPLRKGFLMLSARDFSDGCLTAKEVQDMYFFRAKIAVLSACQTGLGKIHDAGIIGLARAFQIAGVPRVVMSLWSVNDDATNELMQAFVRYMQNDVPSEALRKAMIDVKRQRPDPSQWASFILFGTPR